MHQGIEIDKLTPFIFLASLPGTLSRGGMLLGWGMTYSLGGGWPIAGALSRPLAEALLGNRLVGLVGWLKREHPSLARWWCWCLDSHIPVPAALLAAPARWLHAGGCGWGVRVLGVGRPHSPTLTPGRTPGRYFRSLLGRASASWVGGHNMRPCL